MTQWIWKDPKWPNFTWDSMKVQPLLTEARLSQGKLLGMMQSFTSDTREKINIDAMIDEMMTTSEIEGSIIDRDSVRSSIYHRLGIEAVGLKGKNDRYVEGLLDIMLDAADHYDRPLDIERLCSWHAALFPTGYSGIKKILVGQLRGEGDMEILSGRGSKITVHYLAPPRSILEHEMERFLSWFNDVTVVNDMDGLIRAAIAHLWFERVHPFDDGNGRIGRAILDMALAQDEKLATRFYSVSSAIMDQRKGYYNVLDEVSVGDMDVTVWVAWFLQCFIHAIKTALDNIEIAVKKSLFWQLHQASQFNERQRKVLTKMLDNGIGGCVGGMTTRKYASITNVSRATAYRELRDLVDKHCLRALSDKGRSSAYELIWPTGQ